MTTYSKYMLNNPYKIVKMFEEEIANYAGSRYAISVDSCTNALFLVCKYYKTIAAPTVEKIILPSKTYLSVPQSVMQAGFDIKFEDIKWKGIYQLKPLPVFDAAKRFRKDMFIRVVESGVVNPALCLSFHIKKHLAIGKGGMVLTNSERLAKWLKNARYEGRTDGVRYHDDQIDTMGYNMYMEPTEAARGLMLLQNMPLYPDDLLEEYKDLREFNLFKDK